EGQGGGLAVRPRQRRAPQSLDRRAGRRRGRGGAGAAAGLLPGAPHVVTAAPGDRAGRLLADLCSEGPVVLARAPGRVNLIGEHTDYNGLPVLPFAIERDVLVAACRRAGDVVEVASTDPRLPPRRYGAASPIPSFGAGDWGNYAKAATQALLDAGIPLAAGGMALRVDGTIPLAAGVSSSSALVVALALAQLALAGVSLERLALA